MLMQTTSDSPSGFWQRLRKWVASLSFRTGCVVAGVCLLCYAISFLQMLLPLSIGMKGALWVVFFGLAKTAQYTALLILGKEGWLRLRRALTRRKAPTGD